MPANISAYMVHTYQVNHKAQAPMLQVICITPGILKFCTSYELLLCLSIHITMSISCEYGICV